jgi:aspartate/methionine/tyrosine aminotransferase
VRARRSTHSTSASRTSRPRGRSSTGCAPTTPPTSLRPVAGLPEFIEALRSYYKGVGLDLATEDIFVTTAGSEAILFVLGAICDPGDEVLVFEPFYTNYNGFSAMVGVTPVPVTTRAEDGYHLPGAPRSRPR